MKLFKLSLICILILNILNCSKLNDSSPIIAHQVNYKTKPAEVKTLKITTLSTMLANQGIGEWGYSALVEVNDKKILFDTGRKPETVLKNAEELGIDLSEVEDVFLSHNHGDHTGGLITLRETLKKINPKAMSKIHVGKGIFSQRLNFRNIMKEIKETLESDGVEFIIYEKQFELYPGVWITGPIDRIHDEKNYGGQVKIVTPEGSVVDNIPEDQSLAINTEKGFIMIAGCGHAGIINTLDHIQKKIHNRNIYAVIGGFHLINASDKHLEWTAEQLKRFGVSKIIGAHCTGINPLFILKNLLQLKRENAVVGSVGDSFDLINGINPGIIAK